MTKVMIWIKNHKIRTTLIVITLFFLPLLIVHLLFKWNSGCDFLIAEWEPGDVLGYIAGFETFVGTTFLGVLSLWQSDQIAQQSQKYNELLKEMDRRKNLPHLRVSLGSRNGSLMNMSLIVENASENIAANISAEDFSLMNQGGQVLLKLSPPKLDKAFLMPGQTCTIRFCNEPFNSTVYNVRGTLKFRDKYSVTHKLIIIGTDIDLRSNNMLVLQNEEEPANDNA